MYEGSIIQYPGHPSTKTVQGLLSHKGGASAI